MRTIKLAVATIVALGISLGTASAQSDLKEVRKQMSQDYSHWYLGAELGVPFMFGDMNSLSKDKTYWGLQYGAFAGYQVTRGWGLELGFSMGENKLGAPGYAMHNYLGVDGNTYYGTAPAGIVSHLYQDAYSKTKFTSVGLHSPFNMNALFGYKKGDQFLTVLFGPAIYMQQYKASLYQMSNDTKISDGTSDDGWGFGAGADLGLRFNLAKGFDMQFKSSMNWINNTNFEGIATNDHEKTNFLWSNTVSAIWKIGKNKPGNILYAPSAKSIRDAVAAASQVDEARLLAAEKALRDAQQMAADAQARANAEIARMREQMANQKPTVVKETEVLRIPNIHFPVGVSKVDTNLYKNELAKIVSVLKNSSDSFVVTGYCDRTGSTALNQKLSKDRAQAVVDYLVSQGISANRLTAVGGGVDSVTSGANQVSILARRVEVTK
ncbi:MAG: OmpA family protein [Rikenellaceae bacterium]|jgi:outer membrane protein OmpA-like peptidoglycan-associated protein|nr:OmpA family protein [Rikenellaceae bacterium]